MQSKKFQKTLQENVDNLYDIAKKENWVFNYDKDSDILYMANLKNGFSEESIGVPTECDYLSMRINKNGTIEGLIVEDFLSFFVPKNKEFKKFSERIIKKEILDPFKGAEKKYNSFSTFTFVTRQLVHAPC